MTVEGFQMGTRLVQRRWLASSSLSANQRVMQTENTMEMPRDVLCWYDYGCIRWSLSVIIVQERHRLYEWYAYSTHVGRVVGLRDGLRVGLFVGVVVG